MYELAAKKTDRRLMLKEFVERTLVRYTAGLFWV